MENWCSGCHCSRFSPGPCDVVTTTVSLPGDSCLKTISSNVACWDVAEASGLLLLLLLLLLLSLLLEPLPGLCLTRAAKLALWLDACAAATAFLIFASWGRNWKLSP